jgi:cyclic pyranopterin phosphate synthase
LELTRRDELDRVLDGVDSALDAGLKPVKINVVMMRGINDDEIVDFAEYGRAKGVTVRFIEFMPLEAGDVWTDDLVVPADEIVKTISGAFPI